MNSLFKTFPLVIFITLVIQVFNMLKSLLLAKYNGISSSLDAFYLANIFTITVFNVIGTALTTVVIPEFAIAETVKKRRKSIESYITIIFIITFIFIVLFYSFLLLGKNIIVGNFQEKQQNLFLLVTFFLMLGQIFRVQTALSTAVLQSNNIFIIPKIANFVAAFVPVVYLIIAHPPTITFLAVWITISYILETIIISYKQYQNPFYRFVFSIKGFDNFTKKMLKNTLPILLSSSVFQIQILVSNYMAAFFGKGYVSILSNTNQIVGIFQILFITNIVSILYPNIARELKKGKQQGINFVVKYTNITNIIIIGMLWGYLVLGNDLISLLFVRGKFTLENARSVYLFGLFLVISLPFNVLRDYCYRIFYSLGMSRIATRNSICIVITNILLIFCLIPIVGAYSIVIAPLCGTVISTFLICIKVVKLVGSINFKSILFHTSLLNIGGFLMFFIIQNLKSIVDCGKVINFCLLTLLGILIYIAYLCSCHLIFKKYKIFKF